MPLPESMFKTNRDYVAFDIETTGFESTQLISVVGLLPPDRHASVIVNTGGRKPDEQDIISVVEDRSRHRLELRVVSDEASLLDELAQLVFERFDRENNTLVGYNVETYRGGFDFKFLRTKCAHHGRDFPFDGVYFADLFNIVKTRFNTTVADESGDETSHTEKNDLVGAHRVLCDPAHEFDPIEDSGQAVSCYHNGRWSDLVCHNVSDLHRTLDIGDVAHRHASPRDLKPYKL